MIQIIKDVYKYDLVLAWNMKWYLKVVKIQVGDDLGRGKGGETAISL